MIPAAFRGWKLAASVFEAAPSGTTACRKRDINFMNVPVTTEGKLTLERRNLRAAEHGIATIGPTPRPKRDFGLAHRARQIA
jgi:hypothetical protein